MPAQKGVAGSDGGGVCHCYEKALVGNGVYRDVPTHDDSERGAPRSRCSYS